MNARRSWKGFGLLLIALCSLAAVAPAAAAGPPDVIGEYAIAVTPEMDGALVMQYAFTHYCASTDFPSDTQYLEVGVPNANFSILDYGPKDWVTSAELRTSGGSWVRLYFARLPKTGDCFDATFSIRQRQMAYAYGEDISFQFTPGWFDFAKIDKLTITWALPGDRNLVRRASGAYSVDDNRAIWVKENLAPNDRYPVELIMARAAYPAYNPGSAAAVPASTSAAWLALSGPLGWVLAGGLALLGVSTGTLALLRKRYPAAEAGWRLLLRAADIGWLVVRWTGKALWYIIKAVFQIIWEILKALFATSDSYGGSYSSGASRSSTYHSSCAHSSCAHSSCARSSCACACAGGGRVGCSRKRIGYRGAFASSPGTGGAISD